MSSTGRRPGSGASARLRPAEREPHGEAGAAALEVARGRLPGVGLGELAREVEPEAEAAGGRRAGALEAIDKALA